MANVNTNTKHLNDVMTNHNVIVARYCIIHRHSIECGWCVDFDFGGRGFAEEYLTTALGKGWLYSTAYAGIFSTFFDAGSASIIHIVRSCRLHVYTCTPSYFAQRLLLLDGAKYFV